MRRTIAAGLITLTTVAAIGFVPTASAEEPNSVGTTTVTGKFWVFEWTNYRGGQHAFTATDRYFGNDFWDGMNESVSGEITSAKNNTNRFATLYDFADTYSCSGNSFTLGPGKKVWDLGNYNRNNIAGCIEFH